MIPKRTLTATLEISTGSLILTNRPPAFQGEVHALALSISLLDGGAAYTPTGNVVAQMYLYWPGTVEMTETVPLTISGSTLTGTLPETLTAVPGCPLLVIQITDEDSGDLIVAAASPIQITNVLGGTVISTRPPTPSEIIYVGRSPYIDGVTGNWVQWDTDAGEYVDTGVHAKGDKGDQGIPGPVASVNGVQPDAQGNVQLGDFGGATSSVAGSSGMVPAPAAGDDDMFLRGDGTWAEAGSVKSVNSQTPDNTGDITLSGANIPSSAITGAANVDAGLSALSGQIANLQDAIAYRINGNTSIVSIPSGSYALLTNSTIAGKSDGLYTASQPIPANTVIDGTYLSSETITSALNVISSDVSQRVKALSKGRHRITLAGFGLTYASGTKASQITSNIFVADDATAVVIEDMVNVVCRLYSGEVLNISTAQLEIFNHTLIWDVTLPSAVTSNAFSYITGTVEFTLS